MTALGFLYPGHSAEDDYPRIEMLLDSDIRLPVVHMDLGEDAHRVDAFLELGAPGRLAAGVEELRLAGAEAVVLASAPAGFVLGWDGAHEQVRGVAVAAGLPASSTSFAFAHAIRELGVRRVAVAATYPAQVAEHFAAFLEDAGAEVLPVDDSGPAPASAAGPGAWGWEEILAMARAGDRPGAEAVLLPDTALRTAAHVPDLERELGKPVLTASQVTVWEALRLVDRRVNAPELGSLFTKAPVVQV
ncbi:decarboxylase [Streptomyces sp. NPDC006552]|uniref:maleate cis-trans isomerase family protein n=1 Tax=Streptomyces sp. NPDC006552 TaxID=3157179 RepID=UPI0033B67795